MGLLDRLTGRDELKKELADIKSEIAKSRELEPVNKEFSMSLMSSGYGEPPKIGQTEFLDQYRDWTYANVNAIARPVADIEYELYRLKAGDKVEEIEEHELLDLLYKVNPFQTKYDWVFTLVSNLLLQGEAVTYLAGRGNNPSAKPTELWSLRPDFMRIVPGDIEKGEFVANYVYSVPGREPINFAPWEIMFMRLPNPKNAYRGMGVIEAAMDTIQANKFAVEWNKGFFYNSARPDAVLMSEQKLGADVMERLKTVWNNNYSTRRNNAQKVAVLEAGLKYQQVQQTAKDMDFLAGQEWTRDKIMAMFGNTKTALGITDDVNRANAEASEYQHTKFTIAPMMRRITDYLNEFLVPLFGSDLYLSFDDPTPESEDLKMKKWEIGLNRVYTINELREEEGLTPVDGGDVIYMPLTQVPLGTPTGNQNVPVKEFAISKTKSAPVKKHHREIIAKIKNRNRRFRLFQVEVRALAKEIVSKQMKRKYEDLSDRSIEKFANWSVKTAESIEKKAITSLQPIIEDMKKEALSYAKKKAFSFESEDDYEARVAAVLGVSEKELIALVGLEVFELLKSDEKFISTSDLVTSFIENSTLEASKSFTNTVKEEVAAILKRGLEDGLANAKIAKEITEKFADISSKRAQLLVRTELSRATTEGTIEAYRQSGVVRGKKWYTAMDERVCPYCAPMNGKVLPLSRNFFDQGDEWLGDAKTAIKMDYSDVPGAPLHPGCRCVLAPVLEEVKSAGATLEEQLTKILSDEQVK